MIPKYKQQDAKLHRLFISVQTAHVRLHVSGDSSTHHQEHKTISTAAYRNKLCNVASCWLYFGIILLYSDKGKVHLRTGHEGPKGE